MAARQATCLPQLELHGQATTVPALMMHFQTPSFECWRVSRNDAARAIAGGDQALVTGLLAADRKADARAMKQSPGLAAFLRSALGSGALQPVCRASGELLQLACSSMRVIPCRTHALSPLRFGPGGSNAAHEPPHPPRLTNPGTARCRPIAAKMTRRPNHV